MIFRSCKHQGTIVSRIFELLFEQNLVFTLGKDFSNCERFLSHQDPFFWLFNPIFCRFKTKFDLSAHLVKHDMKGATLECPVEHCGFVCKNLTSFEKHTKEVHKVCIMPYSVYYSSLRPLYEVLGLQGSGPLFSPNWINNGSVLKLQ